MTLSLKSAPHGVDNEVMHAMSSYNKPASRLRVVPVPVWMIGLTSWALAFRRLFSELLG